MKSSRFILASAVATALVSTELVHAQGDLDDSAALPGQVVVAGTQPGVLKYNGGKHLYLVGPDNPEDFLFHGELNEDGTRSGGGQEEMIARLAKAGVNAFHCQMFRMQVCNYKQEGNDQHCPFVNFDPAERLNEHVLEQWDGWLDLFEKHGIVVHLEFYNDATDVELMGWKLDESGRLHHDEAKWIKGIVGKFKHHKNIIWGIEESCNKLPRERTAHFKEIGNLIAAADQYHHPIVQSFVVPNDPEGDFPEGGITSDEYIGDKNIRLVTWLHIVPHGNDLEAQHQEYLSYYLRDADKFVVLKNETFHHPKWGPRSRQYMWSCAMTGMHALEAYHHADTTPDDTLADVGRIRTFMEQTAFYKMRPNDSLAAGSTKWVLAAPGDSYIAYTYDYQDRMGLAKLPAGTYNLHWFDTTNGVEEVQSGVVVSGGVSTWQKPASIGDEIALHVKRL